MSEMSQEDLGNFNNHLTALADDAGFELDDADRMRLFQLSQEGGFNPEATEAAFVDLYGDFDEEDEPVTRQEFEEWVEQQQPQQQTVDEDDDGLSPGMQRLVTDTTADAERLATKLGRPLLQRELDQIAGGVLEQANRFGQIDVEAAAGAKSYDDMTPDEVNDAMVERARDLEGQEEPDPDREYDLGNDKDFVDYATLRIEGGVPAEDFRDVYADDGGEAA